MYLCIEIKDNTLNNTALVAGARMFSLLWTWIWHLVAQCKTNKFVVYLSFKSSDCSKVKWYINRQNSIIITSNKLWLYSDQDFNIKLAVLGKLVILENSRFSIFWVYLGFTLIFVYTCCFFKKNCLNIPRRGCLDDVVQLRQLRDSFEQSVVSCSYYFNS